MTIPFSPMPTSLDFVHVALALLIVVLIVIISAKKKVNTGQISDQPTSTAETPKTTLVEYSPAAALQLLSLLQQEARFIDFLQEDLTHFSDEEVGAAARVVHQGSKKVLNQHFTIVPMTTLDEESPLTLQPGYNAAEFRVTGNVTGEPPFSGTLIHKGWKAESITLPKLSSEYDANILAPAEVEL